MFYEGDQTYPYYRYIKTPADLKMSSRGDLKTLSANVNGLISYSQVLVSGDSKASTTGRPLGNKYFMYTGVTCQDVETNTQKPRYLYASSVPSGDIPLLSDVTGTNLKDFKGLVPGLLSNLRAFNPFSIMQSFASGTNPQCQKITMETIDNENRKGIETQYVTLTDIGQISPCLFPNKRNPITGGKCQEAFGNMVPSRRMDPIEHIYLVSLGLLGIYIIGRCGMKY